MPPRSSTAILWRIDLVVFGLAPVNGFHVERMTQDEGDAFSSAEVGQPVPGEETFDGDDQILTIGRHGLEERFRGGFHVAVQQDLAILVQDTDVHAPGMQVDPAVKWVWLV